MKNKYVIWDEQLKGVRGINLAKNDHVVSMLVFPPDVDKTGCTLLTVTSGGFAKRSDFAEYRTQSRGGKGIINLKVTQKNGFVVGILPGYDRMMRL